MRPIGLALSVLIFIGFGIRLITEVPEFAAVRRDTPRSESVILARNGVILHEQRVRFTERALPWVSLEKFPPELIKMVLQAEDGRFFSHAGVDIRALGVGLLQQRGGSTITMQVVNLLDRNLHATRQHFPLLYKLRQIAAALLLELFWQKREILEAYLNLVPMRGESVGIPTASRVAFARYPIGLSTGESALLAASIKAPNAKVEVVRQRACALLRSASALCQSLPVHLLTQTPSSTTFRQSTPHLARRLASASLPETVVTSLDSGAQTFLLTSLRSQLAGLKDEGVHDGAALVVENRTGSVVAYVGNQGTESSAVHIDGVTAQRQAGSTLKPFLYATALERGLLTPTTTVTDAPLHLSLPSGTYSPRNYDERFYGEVPTATALASSLNTPAVRVLDLVSPPLFVEDLVRLGIPLRRSAAHYGMSLALGSPEVTLESLVMAYRALATGRISPLCFSRKCSGAYYKTPWSKNTRDTISTILADNHARALSFGLSSPLAVALPAAVKTGTSRHMRDNWCVGYSTQYTVGVWVGNFNNEPMRHVTGVSGAAPVWAEMIEWLHTYRPTRGVSRWQQKEIAVYTPESHRPSHRYGRIVYPSDRARIALDPDIPEQSQRILIQVERPSDVSTELLLDGKKVGSDLDGVAWKPNLGKHHLRLVTHENETLDAVEFSVH